MPDKILVTGSNGQLGNELRLQAGTHPGFDFLFTDVEDLDITDEAAVESAVVANGIRIIINCAAYTAVDKAEKEEKTAFLVNSAAVANLARVSSRHELLLIHVSTDYVFDGKRYLPYTEDVPASPVSVYAKSKYAGEGQVVSLASRAVVIRTSWLYSEFGANFVKTIMKKGKETGKLNIVYDQTGTPTCARELAAAILEILEQRPLINGVEIFHFSDEGVTSWYDFAKAVIEFSGITCRISPIRTEEYPLPAVRPFFSVFDKSKIRKRFNLEIPYWRDSLKACIERIKLKEN